MQARGLVWVPRCTKVYYKGGKLYSKTGRGEFMPEDEAKKDGNREVKPTEGKIGTLGKGAAVPRLPEAKVTHRLSGG